jgi:uncharacterized protein
MDNKQRVRGFMGAMSQGRVGPLFDAMAEDVTWRWMGVNKWSRAFEGKRTVADKLFGGATETLGPSSSVEVHSIHADGDCVAVEHSGRNEMPDGCRYDNNVRSRRDPLASACRVACPSRVGQATPGRGQSPLTLTIWGRVWRISTRSAASAMT